MSFVVLISCICKLDKVKCKVLCVDIEVISGVDRSALLPVTAAAEPETPLTSVASAPLSDDQLSSSCPRHPRSTLCCTFTTTNQSADT